MKIFATKLTTFLLLGCLLVNSLTMGSFFLLNSNETFSAAVDQGSSILYCFSMASFVMKMVKNVYADRQGLAVPRHGTSQNSKSQDKKKANADILSLFIPKVVKLDKSLTVKKVIETFGSPAANVTNRLIDTDALILRIFGLHSIVLMAIFLFFMMPRGAIDSSNLLLGRAL